MSCLAIVEEPEQQSSDIDMLHKLFKSRPSMNSATLFLIAIFFLLVYIGYTTTLHITSCNKKNHGFENIKKR